MELVVGSMAWGMICLGVGYCVGARKRREDDTVCSRQTLVALSRMRSSVGS